MNDLRKATEMTLFRLLGDENHDIQLRAAIALLQVLTTEVTGDVDAVNISQERVDERAKGKRKWVGLTEDEALYLLPVGEWEVEPTLVFAKAIEDRLKDMNT
jgi:hypothetical protein